MQDFNQAIIEEFRANKGVVGGGFAGSPIVLLHTTGAKSDLERVNPLVCLPSDEGVLYVFASKGGAPTDPDWYHNLVAHPDVTVEYGEETFEATATTLPSDERDRIYAEQAERYPTFGEYQEKAGRTIPVVALRRH